MTCPCFPICHRRHWPRWFVISLFIAGGLILASSLWFTVTITRYYAESQTWQREAQRERQIADGMMGRDIKRQLALKAPHER